MMMASSCCAASPWITESELVLLSTAAHRAEPAAAAPISYFWKVIPSLAQTLLLLLFIKRLGGRETRGERRMSKET